MRISDLFRILRTPSCWMRADASSRALSDFINESLDSGVVPFRLSKYTVSVKGVCLWIGNYPYGYGNAYGIDNSLPDRTTVFRLADAVNAACPIAPSQTREDRIRVAIEKAVAANDDHTPPPDMAA